VYDDYKSHLDALFAHPKFSSLKRPFPGSIFPAAALNFGPRVCCYEHRDAMNVPHGLCAITALGKFNHKMGGHLILHDLKLFIQFPAGALVLIPSATLRHANTPVKDHETRLSFTQFCAGALLRYVDYGFRTDSQFRRQDKAGYAAAMKKRPGRWKEGLAMVRTVDELLKPFAAVE
jgi:hypothetical protein